MKTSRRRLQSAFTLVEAMVAIGMFGIYAAVSVTALLRMNYNAALSRLRTGASTVAQTQIDKILADSPFDPLLNETPPELTLGTPNPTDLGSSTNPTVPVYTDPTTGISVNGWMTTSVTNNSTINYLYSATVTVSYIYRGKTYSVVMSTLRASDL